MKFRRSLIFLGVGLCFVAGFAFGKLAPALTGILVFAVALLWCFVDFIVSVFLQPQE